MQNHHWLNLLMRRPRLEEYGNILDFARNQGYCLTSVDYWCANSSELQGQKTLVLRHDVDHMPAAALALAQVEHAHSAKATFYFRWSTADREVVHRIRKLGGTIGFHYETLTRYARVHGLRRPEDITEAVVDRCQVILKREVTLFKILFGPIDSMAHHGDPIWKRIKARNYDIIKGTGPQEFGIKFLITDDFLTKKIHTWCSDTSELSPHEAVGKNFETILLNTHPHYWVSGFNYILWKFKMLSRCYFSGVNRNHADLYPILEKRGGRHIWERICK